MKEKTKDKTISLAVTNDLIVRVIPNDNHEFLMTTHQVAGGYDVSYDTIYKVKQRHSEEFIDGQHFISSWTICPDGAKPANNAKMYWTKAGVVRLGFFIKSERAKLFRDWAERLILKLDEQLDLFGNVLSPTHPKAIKASSFNPMTKKNIMSIMMDICEIEDKELRMRIANKLTGKEVIR